VTDELTPQEKEEAINNFYNKQNKMCRNGRIMVSVIITVNFVMILIWLSIIINIFGGALSDLLSIQLIKWWIIPMLSYILLSIALYGGVTWVRYLFAVSAIIAVIISLSLRVEISPMYVIFLVMNAIYSTGCAIILFKSKSISEFLYAQKNR
jgi:hypothetical protein